MPIARARSAGSTNTLRMIDIATGLSIEPPIAWSTRAAIRAAGVGATAHSSEPSENTSRPTWNTRFRPTRSAVEPASMSRLARTRVYASTVHCSPDSEEPRERWMAGSAMFTIVASSPTIRRPVEQITSTSSRRRFELMSVTVAMYHVDDSHCRHENRDHGSLATRRTRPPPAGGLRALRRARLRPDHGGADRRAGRAHGADVLPPLRRQARGRLLGRGASRSREHAR